MSDQATVADAPSADVSVSQSPSNLAVPSAGQRLNRQDYLILAGLLLAFVLARGVIFPYAQNLYGDSVVRSEIAERWAQEPQIYKGFHNGAYQFGPLHFYFMGILLKLWPSREHATRLVSLLMGLLVVLPAYRLGKRLFSRRAAIITVLAMSVWGLHIQASTTAASEAIFLTIFLFCLDYLFEGMQEARLAPIALAALCANLFCAMRYDGWLYVPILALALAVSGKDRIASITRSLIFVGLCSLFPLWWMQQNENSSGDALYPIHFINQFHARSVAGDTAWLGNAGQRLVALFFWPGAVLVTCSLLVGFFGLAGMVRAWVKKEQRMLTVFALAPVAYYAFRGAVLVDFSPLSRFFMAQIAISLFYVESGFNWVCGPMPKMARRSMAIFATTLAIASTLGIGYMTAWKSGGIADTLRPISPLSTIPVEQMAVAKFLKKQVAAADGVVIDQTPQYVDINIAFFTGLPEERLARRRWENFEKQLARQSRTPWIFAATGGKLATQEGLRPGDELVTWRGHTYKKVFDSAGKFFVYHLTEG